MFQSADLDFTHAHTPQTVNSHVRELRIISVKKIHNLLELLSHKLHMSFHMHFI